MNISIKVISRIMAASAAMMLSVSCVRTLSTDVLVIGGSTSGTAAAIAAARQQVEVLVVEETPMLGGMVSAQGVSATDGNYELHTGIWKEFQDSLFAHYGSPEALMTGWVSLMQFEPHVADRIFKNILGSEEKASVIHGYHVVAVEKVGDAVKGAVFEDGNGRKLKVNAKVTIDATDLGDVLPLSGTEYSLGMDDKGKTGESKYADVANDVVQDLTLVGVLKDYGPDADMTIDEPEGFDRSEFDGLNITSEGKSIPVESVLTYGKLPGGKYMLNWPGRHGNDVYLQIVELSHGERQEALKAARAKTLRFIYYIQTVLGYRNLGIADDEFDTPDGLAYLPYNREGRRLKGVTVMTIDDMEDRYRNNRYRTAISVGNYPVDHHHSQYGGKLSIHFPKVPSFSVSAGVLIPEKTDGLIVSDKAISVTNLANGSTRLQPVVMATGQAAGTLAALSVLEGVQPRNIPVRRLQSSLLEQGCYLQPLYDVAEDDPDFLAIHRVASTGILRMEGEPWNWANRTWFHPEEAVQVDEIIGGIQRFYPSCGEAEDAMRALETYLQEPRTRREWARIIDEVLDPFSRDIDFEGNVIAD